MKIDHPALLDSLRKAYSAARSLDMCWSGYWGFSAVVFIVMRSLKMKEYYDKLLSFNKKLDSEDEPEI